MPELDFKGKEFVRNHHLVVPYRPLVPDASKSIGDPDLNGNLIIHGDNLEALVSLLPRYANKVDCIFIDPPYNTGNEGWCYNDNVNSPLLREWFKDNPVGIDDTLRHDKWCAMMWPRLKLLWELLSETGSLWMTIDNTEVHRARALLDEVFGEDNAIVNIVWQKRTSPESRKIIANAHDNVLGYSKVEQKQGLRLFRPSDSRDADEYANPDHDDRGPWTSADMSAQGFRTDQMYTVVTPGGTEYQPPPSRCWGMTEPEYLRLRADNRVWFGKAGNARPRIKLFLSEADGVSDWSWWTYQIAGSNEQAKKEIIDIFQGNDVFDTPKPVRLLSRILALTSKHENALVLDSFAGSGTTAHAVLKMNADDGGNRKFILVEMEDYADTLTAERVRRVIHGYPFEGTQRETLYEKKLTWTEVKKGDALCEEAEKTKADHAGQFDDIKISVDKGVLTVVGERKIAETAPGLGGSFTYCTLGEPIELQKLLAGEGLPSREDLGDYLLHLATGKLDREHVSLPDDLFQIHLAKQGDTHYWLLYQPDLGYLNSQESALTLDLARKIGSFDKSARHVVYSTQKYLSQKLIRDENLRIEHSWLPYAIFRR